MARISAWALAALLILPVYSRAADDVCERAQAQPPQQRGQQQQPQQQPQQPDAKNGRGDQGRQPPPKWWIDTQPRQQLGITDSQSKQVEDIWQKSLPELRNSWHQLRELEDQVSKMILDGAPEAAVTAQIELTEKTRAQHDQQRLLLLYRMFKVLTPDQRAKVNAMFPNVLFDDHRDGRRGGSK